MQNETIALTPNLEGVRSTGTFLTRLDLACAKSDLRPSMQYVVFQGGYAVATDAITMVKQSLSAYDLGDAFTSRLEGIAPHRTDFAKLRKARAMRFEGFTLVGEFAKGREERFRPATVDGGGIYDPARTSTRMQVPRSEIVLQDAEECESEEGPSGAVRLGGPVVSQLHHLSLGYGGAVEITPINDGKVIVVRGVGLTAEVETILCAPYLKGGR